MQAHDSHCRDPVDMRKTGERDFLLERVRARGQDWELACSLLLKRHRAAVYRRCLQRLGNVHDAEDALQETLLRAMHAIGRFEGRSGLRTWLFAIANNECSSLVQRRKRHQYSEHLRCLVRIYEENRRVSLTADLETARDVHETLRRLPPTAREVLGLRFFREASFDEIARMLGISLSAAKMRVYRALEMFKVTYPDAGSTGVRGTGFPEAAA